MLRRHLANLKRLAKGGDASSGSGSRDTVILDAGEPDDATAPAVAELREGQIVRGRHAYRLRELIGSGGVGVVWTADCIEIDNDAPDIPPELVAIKLFKLSSGGDGSSFLRRELAALRSMRSQSVPRVYDWAINSQLSFFVMDYYRHGTLADDLRAGSRFDDEKTWRFLSDMLRTLQVAHRAAILHLDIKPSNIMRNAAGGYKLIDFGIAQATQAFDGPGLSVGAGSRGYQAPEQRRLELHRVDTRTDLWALGATAWALRAGCDLTRHPDKLKADASGDEPSLPSLSTERPDVSPQLDELIAALVREDQESRPGAAATVLEQIKAITGMSLPEEQAGARPRPSTDEEIDAVIEGLMDPLWSSLCSRPDFRRYIAKFEEGDYLCREGEASHDAFVLLSGKIRVEKAGRTVEATDREGTFIGEISALTGTSRAASARADSTLWTCMFNAAEFERLLAAHPSMGIRLLKLLAERMIVASRAMHQTDPSTE